jgi:nucleoside-diphosphate-sugar epimerase
MVPLSGDIRDPLSFDTNFDVLFHCASPMPWHFSETGSDAWEISVRGIENAIASAAKNDAHLVFASTSAVYQNASNDTPVAEGCALGPETAYAKCKLECENLIARAAERGDTKATSLRLFNPYGRGQSRRQIVGYLADCMWANEEAKITAPEDIRDFIHVSDVCRGFLRATYQAAAHGTFNIGSGLTLSITALADIAAAKSGGRLVFKLDACAGPNYHIIADISRAADAIGWAPRIDIETGLTEVFAAGPLIV